MMKSSDIEKVETILTKIECLKKEISFLNSSKEKLQSSLKDIKSFVPIDCVEVDLRSSYDDLGLIIGETVSDEIMDKVFREFCVGK